MQNLIRRKISVTEFKKLFRIGPLEAYPQYFEEMQEKRFAELDKESITLTNLGIRWQQNIFQAFAQAANGDRK